MMSVGIGLLRLAIVLLVIAAIWRVGKAVGEPRSDHGQQNIPDSVEADRLR